MKRSKPSDPKLSQKIAQELIGKYEKELSEFEDWIKTMPRLPQNMGWYWKKHSECS